jgi:hypothetical protein
VCQRYSTNNANLGPNHDTRICSLVVTITFVIVFFEVMPERTILSIPIEPEEEHNIAIPTSCGFSTLLTQKKEQEYKEKQNRRTILIVGDEPDITGVFEKV